MENSGLLEEVEFLRSREERLLAEEKLNSHCMQLNSHCMQVRNSSERAREGGGEAAGEQGDEHSRPQQRVDEMGMPETPVVRPGASASVGLTSL